VPWLRTERGEGRATYPGAKALEEYGLEKRGEV